MKKWILIMVMVITVHYFDNAHAVLIDRGGGLIYDTILDVTWMQDANYINTTGYDDALYGYDTGGRISCG